ncbi:MAG: alanine dehydrogenase [Alphaproteobacteria bacterium]|nr:alanine dehydrogenase [Alphaproteobacteria bacterium]
MLVGVPKEIKVHEYRVGLTPASARELVQAGHKVMVEAGAGASIGFEDSHYKTAGAVIAPDAKKIFAEADMIVKVKEPQLPECAMLREGQLLFTYLHLAPDPDQTKALLRSGCVGVAYETVTDKAGRLPLLTPMSEVAGRMAVQAGAHYLEKVQGGRGVLLGGVPGVLPARVVVLGGGVVGTNAVTIAVGMGARVKVIDRSLPRLAELDAMFGPRIQTVYATSESIETHVLAADLVIGAVLIPGDAAPKLVTRDMVRRMQRGSVIVDVAIDQGGCVETARPTTHADPVYTVDGVIHYCVANMPGGVARTSTFALNNATLPYTLALAGKGWRKALAEDAGLRNGLNVAYGKLTHAGVARALGLACVDAETAISTSVP